MTLVLVMILAALFIVLIVAVLVGQRHPRVDRRRRRASAAGDEATSTERMKATSRGLSPR